LSVLGLVTIGSLIISVDQIKETIMKKIIFWTALISVVAFFIGACAKRDDTAITATTVTCSTTASGSITVGNDTVSSSYLMYTGPSNAPGCIAMTNAAFPTGTQSLSQQRIITSSTSFVDYVGYFSDTACTTGISYMYNKSSSLSVVSQVTGLDTSQGAPSSGYRVTYKSDCTTAKGETDAGTEKLNFRYSNTGVYLTTGTEKTFSTATNTTTYSIWGTADNGTHNFFYSADDSQTDYPSDWDNNNDTTYVK
jgi:hypothetical protein